MRWPFVVILPALPLLLLSAAASCCEPFPHKSTLLFPASGKCPDNFSNVPMLFDPAPTRNTLSVFSIPGPAAVHPASQQNFLTELPPYNKICRNQSTFLCMSKYLPLILTAQPIPLSLLSDHFLYILYQISCNEYFHSFSMLKFCHSTLPNPSK